jgi:four helix bundle protein
MENEKQTYNDHFRYRTRLFAKGICRWVDNLPRKDSIFYLKGQIVRSGTSVAANFRAACRARSLKEYFAKICIVVEECDEVYYWVDFIADTYQIENDQTKGLITEAAELLAVFSRTKKRLKERIYPE